MIEGYLDGRGYVETEGPYGEFLGYYGGVKQNPVFHLTAITHRRDALFQTATISGRAMDCTDTAHARRAAHRGRCLARARDRGARAGRRLCDGVERRHRSTCASRCASACRARRATRSHAVLRRLVNVKNVFVVDPDIDIFSDEQMDWALATRFQADRDLS